MAPILRRVVAMSPLRLRVLAGPAEWTADLSAERAAALPIGARGERGARSAGALGGRQ